MDWHQAEAVRLDNEAQQVAMVAQKDQARMKEALARA
jgi:hypothetical protein